MSLSDIPEFVEVFAGDIIRADDWDQVQRKMRNALRTHAHTHVAGTAVNDAATVDEAQQITTAELADGAVTPAKLAGAAIGTANLADGSVTNPKLAANAVGTANIANNAVTSSKLSFSIVNTASLQLGPGATVETLVQASAASTKTTPYFPTTVITGSTGTGISNVTVQIVYRQTVGANTNDVFIRLSNSGGATATVIWAVLTFAS